MEIKTVRQYKYKNIAIAMAVILMLILIIFTACFGEKSDKTKDSEASSLSGKDISSSNNQNALTNNFRYVSIKNDDAIGKGVLTLVNTDNEYTSETSSELVGVYDYLFNKSGEQIMSASSTEVKGEKALMEALNSMMSDFYNETELTNVIVNTVYYSSQEDNSDEESQEKTVEADIKEHETGYAFDLNTYTADTGSYPEFTGEGKYKWILENCYKYGIIQRYTQEKADITGVGSRTNHFRYVGKPHAEIMTKNNLCLEEYLDYIKDYSFEEPLLFESEEMITYAVYYIAADKEKTTNLPIPLKENDSEYPYAYSGNNKDGYIMWVVTEDNSKLLKNDSSSASEKNSSSKTESSSDNNDIKDSSSVKEASSSASSLSSENSREDSSSANNSSASR